MEFKVSVFRESQRRVILEKRKSIIGYILLVLSILFFVLEYYTIGFVILGSTGFVYFMWSITLWNKLEPVLGSFPFDLKISEEGIQLGRKLYPMNEIRIQKFVARDCKYTVENSMIAFVRYPSKSNGTRNYLNFFYKESEYKLRFRIENRKHMKEAAETREALKAVFKF